MKTPSTLKRSLSLSFATVALLPLLIVSVLVLYHLTVDRAGKTEERNLLLARAVSGQVEGFLREPQETLRSIAGLLRASPSMDRLEVERVLDVLVGKSELLESIYILDRQGKVQNVGLPPAQRGLRGEFLGTSLGHLPFFRQALDSAETTWSDTFFSVISGRMSLALALAVDDKVLVGNFSIELLNDFVQRLFTGEHLIVSVVDRRGHIVAHPEPGVAARQVNIGHLSPVRRGLSGQSGTYEYSHENESYIGSTFTIPGAGWVTLVSQTTEDAYRDIRHAGNLFLCGALAALLLSLLFSLIRARQLALPLSKLSTRARRIAGGDYDPSFSDPGCLEVEVLAESFLNMTTAIRDREEQLLENRENYRLLVETMNDGLVSANRSGVITYLNPRMAEMLGYPVEELVGRRLEDFFDENNRTFLQQQLADREARPYEIEWTTRGGGRLPTLVSPRPLFELEAYLGSITVVTDITARKKAEGLIRQSLSEAQEARNKIDAILRSVPNGLIVTDMRGRIVMVNPFAERVLGRSFRELFDQPVEKVIGEAPFKAHLSEALAYGKAAGLDLQLFDHLKEEGRTFRMRSSPVLNRESLQTGVVIVLRDVTRERESDRMKSEFIATAAHELNTPLTSIMGYSELLLNAEEMGGFAPEQQKEFLTTIYEKGEALSRLVEDLLHLSRMESGRTINLEMISCDIAETIRSVVTPYKREARGHSFELALPTEKVELVADDAKVVQVLENLISNAVKYSPQGGAIRISGIREGENFLLSVEDQGIGMNPEQLERVFEKFYRADPTSTAVAGLGLGMSIVKNIIEAHGGEIRVESDEGKGTRVVSTFPLGP